MKSIGRIRSGRTRPGRLANDKRDGKIPSLDERVVAFLAACPAAISGEYGSHRTFSVTCVLTWGFGLDENKALEFLKIYNGRCRSRWTDKELKQKI